MIRRQKWTTKYDGANVYVQDRFHQWVYVHSLGGYGGFDNNGGGVWIEYINIPITTTPSEYAQYKITITSSSLTIDAADGTNKLNDTTSGVWTNFWNNVKSDGSDIRVFDQARTQMYFWVESFDYANQSATICAKVLAGSTELNITYGNSYATQSTYHNGNQVFEFFDDFEDADISDWTIYSGPYQLTTTHVYAGNYGLMKDINAYDDLAGKAYNYNRSYDIKFEFAVKLIENAGTTPFGVLLRDKTQNNGYLFHYGRSTAASSIKLWTGGTVGSTLASGGTGVVANTWYNSKITMKVDGTIVFEDGTGATISATDSTYSSFDEFTLMFYRSTAIDEIKVLKLVDPATFGTPSIVTF